MVINALLLTVSQDYMVAIIAEKYKLGGGAKWE